MSMIGETVDDRMHAALAVERWRGRLGGWLPLAAASLLIPGAPLAVAAEWLGRDEGYPRGFPWYIALPTAWLTSVATLLFLLLSGVGLGWAFPSSPALWPLGLVVLNLLGSLAPLGLLGLAVGATAAVVRTVARSRKRPDRA